MVDVTQPSDLDTAEVLLFPGVGSFGSVMGHLREQGLVEPLRKYLQAGRPYIGICLGMQVLFESSEESPGVEGLGVIPGPVNEFDRSKGAAVPHIGWNGVNLHREGSGAVLTPADRFYFVHSFHVSPTEANNEWILGSTNYAAAHGDGGDGGDGGEGGGDPSFVSMVQKGSVVATQFHPEKSGAAGLALLDGFIRRALGGADTAAATTAVEGALPPTQLAKRVVACLDVRANDNGDLVVTKGDQYDVREEKEEGKGGEGQGAVRNLGKPVELAARYYEEGADEITFLNITSFREMVLEDQPMLRVLEEASREIFVPLTVGGGIRDMTDGEGKTWSALEVASRYFRAGADKVSIGSDAVLSALQYWTRRGEADSAKQGEGEGEGEGVLRGDTSIEQISHVYGRQAVVISVDPRRVYLASPEDASDAHRPNVVELLEGDSGPAGERYAWYACTMKGGREQADLDVVQLAVAMEALGAGELLVNCVDKDGQKSGFETPLLRQICAAVTIPVIASSGAGVPSHFYDVFTQTTCQAALAAGIFHRREVAIEAVKGHLTEQGLVVRSTPLPAVAKGVTFLHVAREWRCKYSEDGEKASATAAQAVITK